MHTEPKWGHEPPPELEEADQEQINEAALLQQLKGHPGFRYFERLLQQMAAGNYNSFITAKDPQEMARVQGRGEVLQDILKGLDERIEMGRVVAEKVQEELESNEEQAEMLAEYTQRHLGRRGSNAAM